MKYINNIREIKQLQIEIQMACKDHKEIDKVEDNCTF